MTAGDDCAVVLDGGPAGDQVGALGALLLAGVLAPKLPEVADKLATIGVSGYWLIEAMRSVFIAAEGPVRVIEPRTGLLTEKIAEPVGRGAAIVAAQALAFLLIAYLMTLLRHDSRKRRT